MDSNDKILYEGASAAEIEQDKSKPLPITPQMQDVTQDNAQRDMSLMPTMDIFTRLHETAKADASFYDHELWKHLEGRLKYLLNMAGLR